MGIKPNKTRRFALRRGFSGLIYALDTEKPPDRHWRAREYEVSPAGRRDGAGKFWWRGKESG
jgi:hypothetical protein